MCSHHSDQWIHKDRQPSLSNQGNHSDYRMILMTSYLTTILSSLRSSPSRLAARRTRARRRSTSRRCRRSTIRRRRRRRTRRRWSVRRGRRRSRRSEAGRRRYPFGRSSTSPSGPEISPSGEASHSKEAIPDFRRMPDRVDQGFRNAGNLKDIQNLVWAHEILSRAGTGLDPSSKARA